ncbi:MAG: tRNA (adenosine(37)-N6)-dimethylallyltransferase MiaA [Bacteroidales bacterium]|jgi:tRNA dimethylallyltransferase|nr:tRNA (adenosine(37)-N6)-dimethylallyltransferase MiaA [Bacteroidales bacterium]
MHSSRKPVLMVIAGPTAVGKTRFAIEVAKQLRTEIISCDSRQMYREMRIGTAVPSEQELAAVPHHFIGNLSVSDYYNASMFEQECLALLDNLFLKYPVVVMTGGAGLYIDAVVNGIDDFPAVDAEIRKTVTEWHTMYGIEYLRRQLKLLDPEHFARVDVHNPKRITKAIEVCLQTGKPYSSFLTGMQRTRPFDTVKIALNRPREELFDRINRRTCEMMKTGLLEEAEQLFPYRHLNALNTVGYRELFDYMTGACSLETATELIRRNTRRYAKRQLTWFARDRTWQWIHPDTDGGSVVQAMDYPDRHTAQNPLNPNSAKVS